MSAFDELADEPRWVAWRTELRSGRPTKVPCVLRGGKAKADDPSTWGSRIAAEARASRIINGEGGGIGIQLGDLGADLHLCGIDLTLPTIRIGRRLLVPRAALERLLHRADEESCGRDRG